MAKYTNILVAFLALGATVKLANASSPFPSFLQGLTEGKKFTAQEKIQSFMDDCVRDSILNDMIPQHTLIDGITRVVSFNIHFWMNPKWWGFKRDPNAQPDHNKMLDVIEKLNADVIAFQEVTLDGSKFNPALPNFRSDIEGRLNKMGYVHQVWQDLKPGKGRFGNLIVSKLPIQSSNLHFYAEPKITEKNDEQRGYINVKIGDLSIYGTHLDVWDETEKVRLSETKELISAMDNDTSANVILLGDLNATRKQEQDYQVNGTTAWDLLVAEDKERLKFETPTQTLDLITNAGYVDSFTKSNSVAPKYTVWAGKVVDFAFIKPAFNKQITGSYVYYDPTSDHTPLIVDIQK